MDLKLESDAPREIVDKLISQVKQRCSVNDNLVNPTSVKYNFRHTVNEEQIVGLN
jgi:uncharacterized OsmC-like protein